MSDPRAPFPGWATVLVLGGGVLAWTGGFYAAAWVFERLLGR